MSYRPRSVSSLLILFKAIMTDVWVSQAAGEKTRSEKKRQDSEMREALILDEMWKKKKRNANWKDGQREKGEMKKSEVDWR